MKTYFPNDPDKQKLLEVLIMVRQAHLDVVHHFNCVCPIIKCEKHDDSYGCGEDECIQVKIYPEMEAIIEKATGDKLGNMLK